MSEPKSRKSRGFKYSACRLYLCKWSATNLLTENRSTEKCCFDSLPYSQLKNIIV